MDAASKDSRLQAGCDGGVLMQRMVRELALELLRDCFEDEIAHLTLRMIRDAQAPRFEALKESHPEIYRDFMAARNGPHEALLRNRRKRVEALTALVEGKFPNAKLTRRKRL